MKTTLKTTEVTLSQQPSSFPSRAAVNGVEGGYKTTLAKATPPRPWDKCQGEASVP